MTKQKKHEPKNRSRKNIQMGAELVCVFLQPQHPGGQESETSLDSETSLQKGNNLQMEVQREKDRKKWRMLKSHTT